MLLVTASLSGLLFFGCCVNAAPTVRRVDGGRQCEDIFITVSVQATNLNISHSSLVTQDDYSQFVQDAVSSKMLSDDVVGKMNVSGTFEIGATLCDPAGQKPTTIQHLTHGIPHDRHYWDLPIENQSWVDVALSYGHSTLAIDRLGVGLSDMPDGLDINQTPVAVEIANEINKLLRAGQIGDRKFTRIINVGHSYGSFITNGLAIAHPTSADALVLTGFGHAEGNIAATTVSWDCGPAHLSGWNRAELRSRAPKDDYAVLTSFAAMTQVYFYRPTYVPQVVDFFLDHIAPIATGQVFTLSLGADTVLTEFKGPVMIITGDKDIPFCNAHCNALMTNESSYYPASSNFTLKIIEDSGHSIPGHQTANDAFHDVQKFLEGTGF